MAHFRPEFIENGSSYTPAKKRIQVGSNSASAFEQKEKISKGWDSADTLNRWDWVDFRAERGFRSEQGTEWAARWN
jgi:hypothetical protein